MIISSSGSHMQFMIVFKASEPPVVIKISLYDMLANFFDSTWLGFYDNLLDQQSDYTVT